MSFVFYDTETTGLHRAFDQILQFAAIRTDSDLNELERVNIRCRLLPHIAPSPTAMLITGVLASQLVDPQLPSHYEMVCGINQKLRSWCPTVFVGFNSIHFDEHLLRQALYQTLHPVYLTNTTGNCRADAMRIAQAASIFAPDVLTIPADHRGQKVFKLEQLAPANGFDHTNAHDALGDVEATIFLCRKLLDQAPKLWSSLIRFSQKAAVSDYAFSEAIYTFTDFFFGRPYSGVVTTIGASPSANSDILVFDLQTDPDSLRSLSQDKLAKRLSQSPKTVRRLKSNASPIVMPFEDAPEMAVAKTLGRDELERRAQILFRDENLRQRLISGAEQSRETKLPSVHVEEQIYDYFYSPTDEGILLAFHNISWEERVQLIAKLEDARLRKLGLRLIYFERPDLLSDTVRNDIANETTLRLVREPVADAWLTLSDAIREVDGLIATATDEQRTCLQEHRQFLLDKSKYLTKVE